MEDIRPVAACASLVTRRFEALGVAPEPATARLLGTAVLSNSLGLRLRLTCEVDRMAMSFLKKYFSFSEDYFRDFIMECQLEFLKQPLKSLILDTKKIKIADKSMAVGQMEVWNARGFSMEDLYRDFSDLWKPVIPLINMVCAGEDCNRIYTDSSGIMSALGWLYPGDSDGNCFKTSQLVLLRKELCRELATVL